MILSTYIRQADAILIVRVFLGILFFLQGYDKVFRIGVKRVVETIHAPLSDKGIAVFFSAIGALIPYEGGYGKYLENNQPGAGFDMASTDDLVKLITSLNKCGAAPVITDMPDKDVYDGCTATKFTYSCGTMNVILIKVQNGGHTWAGGKQYLPKFMIGNVCRDFNAEDEVFNFFLSTMHK